MQNRRYSDPESADANDLGQLDADAIASVRDEAWPHARNADEMHEALVALGVVTDVEAAENGGWTNWLGELAAAARATRLDVVAAAGGKLGLWVAAERLAQVRELYPDAVLQPVIEAPAEYGEGFATRDEALREMLRARLGGLGPTTAPTLATPLGLTRAEVELGLLALQAEGYVLQGRFTPCRRSTPTSSGASAICSRASIATR